MCCVLAQKLPSHAGTGTWVRGFWREQPGHHSEMDKALCDKAYVMPQTKWRTRLSPHVRSLPMQHRSPGLTGLQKHSWPGRARSYSADCLYKAWSQCALVCRPEKREYYRWIARRKAIQVLLVKPKALIARSLPLFLQLRANDHSKRVQTPTMYSTPHPGSYPQKIPQLCWTLYTPDSSHALQGKLMR